MRRFDEVIPQPVPLCWPKRDEYGLTMASPANIGVCGWQFDASLCAGDDARDCVNWSQILLM